MRRGERTIESPRSSRSGRRDCSWRPQRLGPLISSRRCARRAQPRAEPLSKCPRVDDDRPCHLPANSRLSRPCAKEQPREAGGRVNRDGNGPARGRRCDARGTGAAPKARHAALTETHAKGAGVLNEGERTSTGPRSRRRWPSGASTAGPMVPHPRPTRRPRAPPFWCTWIDSRPSAGALPRLLSRL